MQVQTYLYFNGRCEEAIEFYRNVLGAEVVFASKFGESPDPAMVPPGSDEKIMHATLKIGETTLMASDGTCDGQPRFAGFSLSVTPPTDAAAQGLFAALGEGGQVQMPLSPTFFASSFGMVADRFGVSWLVYVPKPTR
jgi:PhnB protein